MTALTMFTQSQNLSNFVRILSFLKLTDFDMELGGFIGFWLNFCQITKLD